MEQNRGGGGERSMHALEGVFQKAPSIVSRKVAGEVILVPIRRTLGEVECLYALDEVGARIWDLLDGQRSLQAVRDALLEEFEVSETDAERDLLALIEHLREIGAVQSVS
jgi:hypothetical protein